jgi:type IV secretion system protein VirD4
MESASQVSGGYPSGQNDGAPKKTAPVVQAVVAEEQRQMEMDFFDENSMDGQRENADVQVFETALKNLGMLEARISEN